MIGLTMPENLVERIRHNLVALRMPRALQALGAVIQQLERGQLGAIEAIDTLLAEEITVREGRRIKAALQMARLATVKLTGFDFSFHPPLAFHVLRTWNLGQLRPRSTATALRPWPAWTSSTSTRSSTSSASPAREKAILPWHWVSRRSEPGAACISVRWPTSSTAWPRPIVRDACGSASAISAAPSC